MKMSILVFVFFILILPLTMKSQEFPPYNDILDTTSLGEGYQIQKMVNVQKQLVIVFVDFPDGRVPSTGQPPRDTIEFNQVPNQNAVGSFGWTRNDTLSPFYKKVRKYVYEDYWDHIFSIGEWVGNRHPDFASHEGFVDRLFDPEMWKYKLSLYGSVRDYWNEVSYGNMKIDPYQTWRRGIDLPTKYNTGIVNRIDSANGKNYIRWLKMPKEKMDYNGVTRLVYEHVRDSILIPMHNLDPSDPNYIEFDIISYVNSGGKLAIVGAGGFDWRTNQRFGGFANAINGQYFVMSEKIKDNRDNVGSIFAPILAHAHEFGHLIGFVHYQGAAYCIMHWGGLRPIYQNCPPHINPWSKIQAGWIPYSNIIRIRKDTTVMVPPISDRSVVAVVTVYGDAGRDNNYYSHSEFFIVEYRNRTGFNSFSGGEIVPTEFTGGALVWHYSSNSRFPITGDHIEYRLGLKIRNYGDGVRYHPGEPTHFYPYHTILYGEPLDSVSNPNTSSVTNLKTGISLNNFSINSGNINFNVNYQLDPPPNYNFFLYRGSGGYHPLWSGIVYTDGPDINYTVGISQETIVESGPGSDILVKNLYAIGSPSVPIIFRGAGYAGNHAPWGSLSLTAAGRYTNISHCLFEKSNGIEINFAPWDSILGGPVAFRNKIIESNVSPDFRLYFKNSTNPIDFPFIDGYDKNDFNGIEIQGKFRLNSEFQILQNKIMTIQPIRIKENSLLNFGPSGKLIINGILNLYSSKFPLRLIDAKLRIESIGAIYGYFSFAGNSKLESYRTGNILHFTGPVVIEAGSTLFFEGDDLQIDGFPKGLIVGENSRLYSVPTLYINPTSALEIAAGTKFFMRDNSRIEALGNFYAAGSPKSSINFSSMPGGSWNGIILNGGGPNTLEYCDIQYAATGITINRGSPVVNYCNINNCGIGISINTGKKNSPLISNNKISDCLIGIDIVSYLNIAGYPRIISDTIYNTKYGMYIRNTDKAEIRSNKIYHSDVGVYVFQSSPVLYRNLIESNYKYGVFSDESNPRFGDYLCEDPGNNVIRYNEGIDLYVIGGNPFLGLFGKQCIIGGYNSLYLQDGTRKPIVSADKGSFVLAQANWWGEYPPKEDLFYAINDSRIDAERALDYDPNRDEGEEPIEKPETDPEEKILKLAIQDRAVRDYTSAITKYNNFINEKPNSGRIKRAVQSLRDTYRDFSIWTSDTTKRVQLINYLNSVATAHPNPSLKRTANMLLAEEQHNLGNFNSAITRYRQVIQNEPNSERERTSLYSLFNIFHDIGDRESAQNVLTTITSKYPNSDHTKISQIRYELMREGTNKQHSKSYQAYDNESSEIPNNFSLSQNYPNPFNPVTVIKYELPKLSYVVLKIYDILGKEVSILVNEVQDAGYKEVTFDANKLSSGVYYYKLQAEDFTSVKKMIFMR